jgi:hypothetical protein
LAPAGDFLGTLGATAGDHHQAIAGQRTHRWSTVWNSLDVPASANDSIDPTGRTLDD